MKKAAAHMRVVWFYHKETGLFHGRNLMTQDPKLIAPNTPVDHIAIEGDHFDVMTQRVDVKTGEILDRLPPRPSNDHEWNTSMRRWLLKPEFASMEAERQSALERIKYLELKALRALREHALGQAAATQRLKAIDDEIVQLRTKVGG